MIQKQEAEKNRPNQLWVTVITDSDYTSDGYRLSVKKPQVVHLQRQSSFKALHERCAGVIGKSTAQTRLWECDASSLPVRLFSQRLISMPQKSNVYLEVLDSEEPSPTLILMKFYNQALHSPVHYLGSKSVTGDTRVCALFSDVARLASVSAADFLVFRESATSREADRIPADVTIASLGETPVFLLTFQLPPAGPLALAVPARVQDSSAFMPGEQASLFSNYLRQLDKITISLGPHSVSLPSLSVRIPRHSPTAYLRSLVTAAFHLEYDPLCATLLIADAGQLPLARSPAHGAELSFEVIDGAEADSRPLLLVHVYEDLVRETRRVWRRVRAGSQVSEMVSDLVDEGIVPREKALRVYYCRAGAHLVEELRPDAPLTADAILKVDIVPDELADVDSQEVRLIQVWLQRRTASEDLTDGITFFFPVRRGGAFSEARENLRRAVSYPELRQFILHERGRDTAVEDHHELFGFVANATEPIVLIARRVDGR
jgi:hypothetical protein